MRGQFSFSSQEQRFAAAVTHLIRQMTTPVPASGRGSPPSCSSHREGTRVAKVVPGGLDPAVGTLDVRDAELVEWPLKGSAMPLTCHLMLRGAKFRSMGSVSLI